MATNQWKLKLFGDLCSSVDGVQIGPFGSQLHASEYVESGIPVVMPKDMINTEISTDSIAYVSEEIANRLSKHRLKAGDLVFARRGDIGRFVIVSSEQTGWLCGTGCIRARFKPNIYPEFISLILQSHSVQHWLKSNAVGQTMLNLNTEIILNLPIRIIDSLESQITLANCVGYWDEAIAITEKLITSKRRLKQGLMQKLLENTDRALNLSKNDWSEVSIGEICEVKTGGTPERNNEKYWENGWIPWMSSGEINYRYITCTREYITQEGLDSSNASILPKGAVMIALNGQGKTRGSVAVLEIETTCNQSLAAIITDSKILDNYFLFFYLDSIYQKIRNLTGESVRNGLNIKLIKSIKVPLLPLDIQKKIVSIFCLIDQELNFRYTYLAKLKTQKQGLMQQLLTGKIRV